VDELVVNYYPNPVSNILHLELPAGRKEIEVYTLAGHLAATINTDDQHLRFDMSKFHAGLYLFHLKSDSQMRVLKVVKK